MQILSPRIANPRFTAANRAVLLWYCVSPTAYGTDFGAIDHHANCVNELLGGRHAVTMKNAVLHHCEDDYDYGTIDRPIFNLMLYVVRVRNVLGILVGILPVRSGSC